MVVRNPILRKHFANYGFNDTFFENYEATNDEKLQNEDAFCSMLHSIKEREQTIVIYTDFDVDGIMSSVIAYAGLSELGFKVELFRPTPADGYGFRAKDVDDIINTFPGVSVILTGDVGISSNEAIQYAKDKGLTVLVTDHHSSTQSCDADIAVNPNQYGETYSHNGICGAFVLYKLIADYAVRYADPTVQANIYRLQMFAGVATISDVMPLLYENRQLVRSSVSLMRYFYNYELGADGTLAPPVYSDNYSRAFVGMKKLLEYFTNIRKIKKSADIDEQFYGFYLVPFLNSCKRMNGNMHAMYDIFFSPYVSAFPDFPNMSCVENGIKYVAALSETRKQLTAQYFDILLAEKTAGETDKARYMNCGVYITDATPGLLGLLASKFMSMTNMTTFVVNANEDGSYSGSGRNPSWFHLTDEMAAYGLNISCAGHKDKSFGVSIPDRETLEKFAAFYHDVILPQYEQLCAEGGVKSTAIAISFGNCVDCDFQYDSVLVKDFMDEMADYHPFGEAFPAPHFNYYIKLDPNRVKERMFGDLNQHVKLITDDGTEILLFNLALDFEKLKYDNRDRDYIFVCSGTFRYDDYNSDEYDTVDFLANDIDVVCLD